MNETRFACIVLLRPNIEYPVAFEQSMANISVSLIAEPIKTPVFVPCKSAGLKPASIIASTDLSKHCRVIMSITAASFGCALKNTLSNLIIVFNFPVPELAPNASVI